MFLVILKNVEVVKSGVVSEIFGFFEFATKTVFFAGTTPIKKYFFEVQASQQLKSKKKMRQHVVFQYFLHGFLFFDQNSYDFRHGKW